ncbi:hypothetical protein K438DRAFT_1970101 [Mycena galopus ATCC 62051]|nr:hypothetical protein K438DRAFT_1970101 [Mycena galopus ATCC 62051]
MALDVGLNRPFKHALKVAYHSWLVDTVLEQRCNGEKLDLDTGLGVLRNASVGWIWEGYKATQTKELVKKAWKMCLIRGGRNLSYECMTSFDTNECLISLSTENPQFWNDLQTKSTRHYCPGDDKEVAEDPEMQDDEEMGDDDSEIPTHEVAQHVVTKQTGKNCKVKAAKGMTVVTGQNPMGSVPHAHSVHAGSRQV